MDLTLAPEVKALFGRQQTLKETYGLDNKIRQAHHSATTVQKLLRSHGVDTPVRPVLVLAGPGAPSLHGEVHQRDGVLIVAIRDSDTWRPVITSPTDPGHARPPLHTAAAAAGAEHLLSFCASRDKHQQAVSARR